MKIEIRFDTCKHSYGCQLFELPVLKFCAWPQEDKSWCPRHFLHRCALCEQTYTCRHMPMPSYAHHHMNHKKIRARRRTDQRSATARHRLILQEHEVPSVWVIRVSRHMRYICFCHLLSASLCPPRHFLYFIYIHLLLYLIFCFVSIWDMAVLKLTV